MPEPSLIVMRRCPQCGSLRHAPNGRHLRALREKKGIGLREMARRLAFSAGFLSDVERNRRGVTGRLMAAYSLITMEPPSVRRSSRRGKA